MPTEELNYEEVGSAIVNIMNGVRIRGNRISPGTIQLVREASSHPGIDRLRINYDLVSPTQSYEGWFNYASPGPGVVPPINCLRAGANLFPWFDSPYTSAPGQDITASYLELLNKIGPLMAAWVSGVASAVSLTGLTITGRPYPALFVFALVVSDNRDCAVIGIVGTNSAMIGPPAMPQVTPVNPVSNIAGATPLPMPVQAQQQLMPDIEVAINNGSSIWSASSNTFTEP